MYLKLFFISLIIGVMLISCGGNKSSENDDNESVGLSEAIGGFKDLKKAGEAAKDWEKIQEKLAAETPKTNDEIKVFFPEKVGGMNRKSFSVGDAQFIGINGGEAKYSDDEDKNIEVSIMDGAGEVGASMVAMYAITLAIDKEEETENGYSKTINFNGNRATVKENSYDGRFDSEIMTIVNDRFIVSLTGDGLSFKDLEKVFNELNLNKLK
jgi:hypothetical protein